MTNFMLVPPSVSMESKQTDRQTDRIALWILEAEFCLYVGIYTLKTTGRANVKLGTIDHHPGVSVLRGFLTS